MVPTTPTETEDGTPPDFVIFLSFLLPPTLSGLMMGTMQTIRALELHSEGEKDGMPFSLAAVPASVLKSALERIPTFVAGTKGNPRTKAQIESALSYAFENGSLRIAVVVASAMAATLRESAYFADLTAISEGRMADVADLGRIEALRDLRRELLSSGATSIKLSSFEGKVPSFDIAAKNIELPPPSDPWVDSESYVMATVVDIGGKVKSNAHLELENGKTITADSARTYLAGLEENLLYKRVLAHVAYQVNLRTDEWRGVRLVSLSPTRKTFDKAAFDKAVSGPSAWDAVEDPVADIRRMRGADV